MFISVVMLAKNKADYLERAANSVLNSPQTELIIVDPGSQDRTMEIAVKLLKKFPNKVKICKIPDKSPAEGLNNGVALAAGEIISILNGDDYYLEGGLTEVIKEFERKKFDILLTSGFVEHEEYGLRKYIFPSQLSTKGIALHNFGAVRFFHQGIFVRSHLMNKHKYNADNKISWDIEQFAEMLFDKPVMKRTNREVAVFRINKNSISSQNDYLDRVNFESKRIAYKFLNRKVTVRDKYWSRLKRVENWIEKISVMILKAIIAKMP
jgi:glycosyltransferase involved in cell wall biosynthesis